MAGPQGQPSFHYDPQHPNRPPMAAAGGGAPQSSPQFQAAVPSPAIRPGRFHDPAAPKAERVLWLVITALILGGNIVIGLFTVNSDGSEGMAAVQQVGLYSSSLFYLVAHTVGMVTIGVIISMILRLTGRSPGRNSL